MQKEDVVKVIENLNNLFSPMGYHVDLVDISENKVKIKLNCPKTQDIFKVQGKIVDTCSETKKTVEKYLKANLKGISVEFEG